MYSLTVRKRVIDMSFFTKISDDIPDIKLEEKVEIHNTLNPKIWKDDELLPEVKEKIEQITDLFLDKLADSEIDIDVEDIYVLGSNANFNYSDESDLDVHIIADSKFNCDQDHLTKLYQAYKSIFNDKYDIKINGINVELYVELDNNLSAAKNSKGIYSIHSGWVKKPDIYEVPEIDEAAVEEQTAEWESRYLNIIKNPKIEDVTKYLDDIYDLRINSIQKDGEFGIGNLVFKEIRKLNYLQDLRDLKIKLETEALSL